MSDEWNLNPSTPANDPTIEIVPDLEALDRLLHTVTHPPAAPAPAPRVLSNEAPPEADERDALEWLRRVVSSFLSDATDDMRRVVEEMPRLLADAPTGKREDEAEKEAETTIRSIRDATMRNLCMRILAIDRRVGAAHAEVHDRLARAWTTVAQQHADDLRTFRETRDRTSQRLRDVSAQMLHSIEQRALDASLSTDEERIMQHHRALATRRGVEARPTFRFQVEEWRSADPQDALLRQHAANVAALDERLVRQKHVRHALAQLVKELVAKHVDTVTAARPRVSAVDVERLGDAQANEQQLSLERMRGVDDERSSLAHRVIELQFDKSPEERARANMALTQCDQLQETRRSKLLHRLRAALTAVRAIIRMHMAAEAHHGGADVPGSPPTAAKSDAGSAAPPTASVEAPDVESGTGSQGDGTTPADGDAGDG
jgi:hypothetical protein